MLLLLISFWKTTVCNAAFCPTIVNAFHCIRGAVLRILWSESDWSRRWSLSCRWRIYQFTIDQCGRLQSSISKNCVYSCSVSQWAWWVFGVSMPNAKMDIATCAGKLSPNYGLYLCVMYLLKYGMLKYRWYLWKLYTRKTNDRCTDLEKAQRTPLRTQRALWQPSWSRCVEDRCVSRDSGRHHHPSVICICLLSMNSQSSEKKWKLLQNLACGFCPSVAANAWQFLRFLASSYIAPSMRCVGAFCVVMWLQGSFSSRFTFGQVQTREKFYRMWF